MADALFRQVMQDTVSRPAYLNTTRGILTGQPGEAFDRLVEDLSALHLPFIASTDPGHQPEPTLSTDRGTSIAGAEKILVAAQFLLKNPA